MRILIVNDGIGDAGGVQVYLDSVVEGLTARGHELAVAYCTADGAAVDGPLAQLPRFCMAGDQASASADAIRRWQPEVCYSHLMQDLSVEQQVIGIAPVVKFMHGYEGTCVSGHKTHAFPHAEACARAFGPACAGLFFPRRCGGLSPVTFVRDLRRTLVQRTLHGAYAAVVVASDHMRREYVANGIVPSAVHVNPLFSCVPEGDPSPAPAEPCVAFLGRMTSLKGGDLLVRAAHSAATRLGRRISLLMIGDGPQRPEWQALALALDVPCTWTGWVTGTYRWQLLQSASIVALPSVWPEPFGLVGLEAGALGVAAVAADVGGIREWLREGENGVLVPSPTSPESFGAALANVLGDASRLGRLRDGARRVASEMTIGRHIDRLEPVLRGASLRGVQTAPDVAAAGCPETGVPA
jgi:glycosyltransferase involved in cell wall biosynthesis